MRGKPGRGGRTMRIAVAVILTAAVAACSSNGSIRMVGSAETCGARAGEKVAAALARCSARSVAYVETPDASGTGIVTQFRRELYVLTNSHVVDPWASAQVLLDGEYYDAPVVGVKAHEDIAVLGPLDLGDSAADPLTLATDATPERGDEVYLVGYPGEAPPDDPDDLEATIAGGIVSRARSVAAFDQTFIQTDASIAGGQSGGPLFDERGRVIGISGLSFADEFALALTARDVARARNEILHGDGDGSYPFVPVDADSGAELVRSGTLGFGDAGDGQQLWVPPSAKDRTLTFQIDLSAGLVVSMTSSTTYDLLATSSNAEQVFDWLDGMFENAATERGIERTFDPDEFEDEYAPPEPDETKGREVAPGSFEVDIEADEGVYIYVEAPIIEAPLSVEYTSSVGVHPLTSVRDVQDIGVGDTVERIIGTFDTGDDFLVELDEGDDIEVLAESAQGDVGLVIYPPSAPLDPLSAYDPDAFEDITYVDDSDIGLYGFDARAIVEAEESGTYRISLYANDQLTIAARLTLTDCDDTECEE